MKQFCNASHSDPCLDRGKVEALAQELQTHSRFVIVGRTFIELFLHSLKGSPLLGTATASEANFIIISYMAYLHHFRDTSDPRSGATLSRIRDYCVEQKICGSRHVFTMLNALRLSGYLSSVKVLQDGRVQRLVPTEKGLNALRRSYYAYAKAFEVLMEDNRAMSFLEEEPEAPSAIAAHCFRSWHMPYGNATQPIYEQHPFLTKSNAMQIILTAYLNSDHTAHANASYGALSRVLGASRSHIQKLFSQAEKDGLVTILEQGGHKVRLEPNLVEAIEQNVATYIAIMYLGTDLALKEHHMRKVDTSQIAQTRRL